VATKRPRRPPPLAERTFNAHLGQLKRHVEVNGVGGVRALYKRAQDELTAQLLAVGPHSKRVEPVTMRAMLSQVDSSLAVFGKGLKRHLADTSATAARLGARQGVDEFKILAKHFTGTTPVVALDRGALFEGLVHGVDSSLLRRYERQSQRWTLGAIDSIEKSLATSVMTGRPLEDTINLVMAEGGIADQERWRAERVVRTENAYAHGHAKQEAITRTAKDSPTLMKRLIATFDDRTGDDSFLLHGQTIPVGAPFTWKHKVGGAWVVDEYMHPPNRPNDREVVVPWDPTWDESEEERPLTRAELQAAPPTRWRKKDGVKIPSGHVPGESYDPAIRKEKKELVKEALAEANKVEDEWAQMVAEDEAAAEDEEE